MDCFAADPKKSIVCIAQDQHAIESFRENPQVVRKMVDSLVIEVTGQRDIASAWQSLVSPADRVGIKVSTAGGRFFSTHHAIVGAIIDGLAAAGVPREKIVIW